VDRTSGPVGSTSAPLDRRASLVDRRAALVRAWSLPRPVLPAADLLSVGLGGPVVAAYQVVGPEAALGLAMGSVGCLLPAVRLPARYALLLTSRSR